MSTITKRTVASALAVSTVGFTPNFTQNYRPIFVNIKHYDSTNNYISKIADSSLTFDNPHEDVADFIERVLGKKVSVTINNYENDSDYLYVNYFNNDLSIDENFEEFEMLNDESFNSGLNFLFTVEA